MANAGNFAKTNSSPTAKLDRVAVPEVTSKGALTFPRVPLALVLVADVEVFVIEAVINAGVVLVISSYHPFCRHVCRACSHTCHLFYASH